jgi:hypothetical protein
MIEVSSGLEKKVEDDASEETGNRHADPVGEGLGKIAGRFSPSRSEPLYAPKFTGGGEFGKEVCCCGFAPMFVAPMLLASSGLEKKGEALFVMMGRFTVITEEEATCSESLHVPLFNIPVLCWAQ